MEKNDMTPLEFVLKHYKENSLNTEKALRLVRRRGGAPLVNWRIVGAVAASIVLIMGLFSWNRQNSTTTLMAYGQVRDIALPDGSVVSLAPGSEISFRPKKLSSGGVRKVSLKGKAFFEVEHVETRPFEVRSEGGFVKVLGTKFQVDADKREVYVQSGMVFFAGSANKDGVILTRGMSAKLLEDSVIPVIDEAATGNQIAWKRGTFIYDGQELSIAIKELEDWYGRDIEIDALGRDISDARVVGSFDIDSPEDVLDAISEAFDISLRFKN